jgi:hypothetical protein
LNSAKILSHFLVSKSALVTHLVQYNSRKNANSFILDMHFGACFATPVKYAAWKSKPSYGIVATEDKAINPDIERNMYHRAGTKITEIKCSHLLFITQPDAVANVITAAANDLNTNQLK